MSSPDGLYQDHFIDGLKKGLMSIQQDWELSDQTDWSLLCVSENATFRADDPTRDNPLVLRRMLEIAWVASHHETPTARQLGAAYTRDVVGLAADYLNRFD